MGNVYCTSKVFFLMNEEEKEILQKTHDIIEKIKHDWYIKDDDAWDNEEYWEIDNTVKTLEKLFKCKKDIN